MRSVVPWNCGAQTCDLGGTQTRDTQNRNLMLYSTELRGHISYYRFAKVSNIFAITKFSTQKTMLSSDSSCQKTRASHCVSRAAHALTLDWHPWVQNYYLKN